MNKKNGQIFVVALWVLMILTTLVLSLGHRVSLGLHLSRYHKDRFQAGLLARAAVNRAIAEIKHDEDVDVDSMRDSWADNKVLFEKMVVSAASPGYAAVSYIEPDDLLQEEHFGVVDEERKININAAPKQLIIALMQELGVPLAEEAANAILIWRGDIPDKDRVYDKLGYPAKADSFENLSELSLVAGLSAEDVRKLQPWFSVFGPQTPSVNINTVSRRTLSVIGRYAAEEAKIKPEVADSVVMKIVDLRAQKGYFKDTGDLSTVYSGDDETNLMNRLLSLFVFKSNFFLIRATGDVHRVKRECRVVFDRKEGKIVYFHER